MICQFLKLDKSSAPHKAGFEQYYEVFRRETEAKYLQGMGDDAARIIKRSTGQNVKYHRPAFILAFLDLFNIAERFSYFFKYATLQSLLGKIMPWLIDQCALKRIRNFSQNISRQGSRTLLDILQFSS
jgi:hypothetical protein